MVSFRRFSIAAALAAFLGSFGRAQQAEKTPALPLSYAARLTGPAKSLTGGDLLSDPSAQQWLLKNRPGQYPQVMAQAFNMKDWRQVMTDYDDPSAMRRAILARPDSEFFSDPKAFLALAESDPALKGRRSLLEAVVFEWGTISPATKRNLSRLGVDEAGWEGLSFMGRWEFLDRAYDLFAKETIAAPLGSEEYARQYEEVLIRKSGVLANEELIKGLRHLEEARRLAAGISRAEKMMEGVEGPAREDLARVKSARTLDAAFAGLAGLYDKLGIHEEVRPAELGLNLTPGQKEELLGKFSQALLRELAGNPVGERVAAFLRERGLRLDIAPLGNAVASYSPYDHDLIRFKESTFVTLSAALGLTPQALLSDPEGLRRMAKLFSPHLVHEATHFRQHAWAREHILTLPLERDGYSQASEDEAYQAEAVFTALKTASDPDFVKVLSILKNSGDGDAQLTAEIMEAAPRRLAEDPVEFQKGWKESYADVPTLERVGHAVVESALSRQADYGPALKKIDSELALRRRRPRSERAEIERRGIKEDSQLTGAFWRTYATSELRRWKRYWDGLALNEIAEFMTLVGRAHFEMKFLSDQRFSASTSKS